MLVGLRFSILCTNEGQNRRYPGPMDPNVGVGAHVLPAGLYRHNLMLRKELFLFGRITWVHGGEKRRGILGATA